jgi:hypothetical protein
MYTIQAQVLLSYYFFWTGHFMAARTHAATAVALATGGGLHHIRSLHRSYVAVIGVTENEGGRIFLPVPSDAEEGERINSFWAVFMLQQNLSVALNPAARVYGEFEAVHIDMPWPLEMEQYRQVSMRQYYLTVARKSLADLGAFNLRHPWRLDCAFLPVQNEGPRRWFFNCCYECQSLHTPSSIDVPPRTVGTRAGVIKNEF